MAKLQSHRYERGYFHKIWMDYYCLDENHASGTLSLKFIRCQNPYQQQNLKILLTFQRHKKPTWAKFLEFDFFYLKRQGYIYIYIYIYIYYQNKNQLGVTSSSYINLTIKLLIKLYLLA